MKKHVMVSIFLLLLLASQALINASGIIFGAETSLTTDTAFAGGSGQEQGGDIASGIDNATPISTTNGGVQDMRLADLDGDGDADVITSSRADNAISWYENTDGAGNFGEERVIAGNVKQASGVEVADINADGNLDVLSVSSADDKIAWYAGDGTGGFAEQQIISTADMGPQDLHAADMDGDGDLDVVTASFYDDSIAWYKNDGSGGFGPRQVISTAIAGPKAVTTADLNGDGRPDVIATGLMNGQTAWFANNGAGNFGAAQVVATDSTNHLVDYLEAADLDGDGDMDLFLAHEGDLAWFENTDGNGTFGPAQTIHDPSGTSQPEGTTIEDATAADMDGDGDLDVIWSSNFISEVHWHENDGTGAFGPGQRIAHYGLAGDRTSVRTADMDGDGDQDVVASSELTQRIGWYENQHGPAPFVDDGIPNQTANAGRAYSHAISDRAFDDTDDGGSLAYSAALADGSPLPGWLGFDPATATFSGTPAAGNAGTLTVRVTAEDTDARTGTDTFELAVTDPAGAPVTQVTHTGDSGAGSLRQAIADADPGDTITFADTLAGDTITLTSGAVTIDEGLTLDGDLDDDGAPDVTVSGNQNSRIFTIDDGDAAAYADVTLDGLVLTDARLDASEDLGGAVLTREDLVLRDSVIRDSSAYMGGSALYAADGATTLRGVEVVDNHVRASF
ncbi:MAG: FG-GAP-like repeat-containing protein, partial [Thermodesulfobacteriota bacterium]